MIYAHQVAALKRDAKARAKHNGRLTLEEHQDQVARENGYSTWQVLMRQVESKLATPEQTGVVALPAEAEGRCTATKEREIGGAHGS